MEDFEKMAQELEKKAEEIRIEGKAKMLAESGKSSSSICCGTCQFYSPCTPFEKTPSKCEGGCTITSYV